MATESRKSGKQLLVFWLKNLAAMFVFESTRLIDAASKQSVTLLKKSICLKYGNWIFYNYYFFGKKVNKLMRYFIQFPP